MKTLLITCSLFIMSTVMAASSAETNYLKTMDEALYIEYANMRMEVYKNDKLIKFYGIEFYRKGTKMRMEFLEPTVEKGRRMLNDDTSLWMYMPKTSKVMKLPLKQSFMGSDASNRDLMRFSFEADYDIVDSKKGEGSIVLLELKAKDLSISYNKVIVSYDTKMNVPIRQEMFSLSGKLIKTMEYEYRADSDGKYIPTVCIIKDALLQNTVTKLLYENLKRTYNKSDLFFTLGSLKQ